MISAASLRWLRGKGEGGRRTVKRAFLSTPPVLIFPERRWFSVCFQVRGVGGLLWRGGGGQKHLRNRDVNSKMSWSYVSDQFQQIIFKRDSCKQ